MKSPTHSSTPEPFQPASPASEETESSPPARCALLKYADLVEMQAIISVRWLRQLRRHQLDCRSCEKYPFCPSIDIFNERVRQAIAEILEEWNMYTN